MKERSPYPAVGLCPELRGGREASKCGGTEVCVGAARLRSCRRHPLFYEIVTLLRPHRDNGRKRPSLRELGSQEGSDDPGPGPADPPHRGKHQMTEALSPSSGLQTSSSSTRAGWVLEGTDAPQPRPPLSGKPALRTALCPGQATAERSQAEPRPLRLPPGLHPPHPHLLEGRAPVALQQGAPPKIDPAP